MPVFRGGRFEWEMWLLTTRKEGSLMAERGALGKEKATPSVSGKMLRTEMKTERGKGCFSEEMFTNLQSSMPAAL